MGRRIYGQFCGVARALDVVGERWTLLIVRDLVLGPQRYSELLRGLPGITTNLLAKRLNELEELGIVERIHGATSDSHAWRLTPIGSALEPAVQALARWGWSATATTPARGEQRRLEWLLFAMRSCYRGGETMRAELVADGVPYRMLLTPASADLSRGDVPSPELRVRGSAPDIARLLLLQSATSRVPAGIDIEGGTPQLRRLLGAFNNQPLAFAGAAVRTA